MINTILFSSQTPTIREVKIYFNQKGMPVTEAEQFFRFYEMRSWSSKRGNIFKSCKNIAYQWIAGVIKKRPELFNRQLH